MAAALAELWRDIEGAVSAVESSPRRGDQFSLASVLDLLVSEVIPRMQAETAVLLPVVGAPPHSIDGWSRRRLELSRLAESISMMTLAARSSKVRRAPQVVSELDRALTTQREAETGVVEALHNLHLGASAMRELGVRLEAAEVAARKDLLFVTEPDRAATEAFALRHNPKPPRIVSVQATGRAPSVRCLLKALYAPSTDQGEDV
jgi:hypothetical protein